jgi:tetratricopeptide (TPR) repeat protein
MRIFLLLGLSVVLSTVGQPCRSEASAYLPGSKKIEFKLVSASSSSVSVGPAVAESEDIEDIEVGERNPRVVNFRFKRRSWGKIWNATKVRASGALIVDGKLVTTAEFLHPLFAASSVELDSASLRALLEGLPRTRAEPAPTRAERIRWLEALVKSAPADRLARAELAWKYMDANRAGDARKAAAQWEAVLDGSKAEEGLLDPVDILPFLRECYEKTGAYDRAAARYRKMLESPESELEDVQLRLLLVEADEKRGRRDAALRDLDAAEAALRSSGLPPGFRDEQSALYRKLRERLTKKTASP